MCNGTFVAAHSRAIFPVLGGISGSTKATLSIAQSRSHFVLHKYKRNDEIRLKCSSFLLEGRMACRRLCAPVKVCSSTVEVRTISSWLPSSRPSSNRPSCHLFSLTSFHLF